jgi:hypothetical protein
MTRFDEEFAFVVEVEPDHVERHPATVPACCLLI